MQQQLAVVTRVCRRGTVVIPARLCKRSNICRGSYVVAQEIEEGILVYPAEPVFREIRHRPSGFLGIDDGALADYSRVIWERKKQPKPPTHDGKEDQ